MRIRRHSLIVTGALRNPLSPKELVAQIDFGIDLRDFCHGDRGEGQTLAPFRSKFPSVLVAAFSVVRFGPGKKMEEMRHSIFALGVKREVGIYEKSHHCGAYLIACQL